MPKFSPVTCTHTHTHTHTQPAVTYCCLSPSTLSDIPHFLSQSLLLALALALSLSRSLSRSLFHFLLPQSGGWVNARQSRVDPHSRTTNSDRSYRDKNTRSLCGSTVLWKVLAYKGFQQFVGRIMRRYEGKGLRKV